MNIFDTDSDIHAYGSHEHRWVRSTLRHTHTDTHTETHTLTHTDTQTYTDTDHRLYTFDIHQNSHYILQTDTHSARSDFDVEIFIGILHFKHLLKFQALNANKYHHWTSIFHIYYISNENVRFKNVYLFNLKLKILSIYHWTLIYYNIWFSNFRKYIFKNIHIFFKLISNDFPYCIWSSNTFNYYILSQYIDRKCRFFDHETYFLKNR